MELAREQSMPPNMIFHDATLFEISKNCPGNLDELKKIGGVGLAKLARYGNVFMEVIKSMRYGIQGG